MIENISYHVSGMNNQDGWGPAKNWAAIVFCL
jgi:hypothetical protein